MIQKRVVDCDWVRGVREGREPGGFPWGDQLFGVPDIVRGAFRKEIRPVGGFGSFDVFKMAELGLSSNAVGVKGPEFFCSWGGFCELLSESGQERGPPSLKPCGWG